MSDIPSDRRAPGDNRAVSDTSQQVAGLDQTPVGPQETAPAPVEEEKPLTPAQKLVDPDIFAQVKAKAREFAATAKLYKDLTVIETKDMAGQVVDFVAGAKAVRSVIDKLRVEAKRPYTDNAKTIEDLFQSQLGVIDKVVNALKPMQEAFALAEKKRLQEAKDAEKRAADDAAAAAQAELDKAKETGDLAAEADAETAIKEAAKAVKKADRPVENVRLTSASGGARTVGLRRSIKVVIDRPGMALAQYKDRPEISALLIQLASADARSAGVEAVEKGTFSIPGFALTIEEGL